MRAQLLTPLRRALPPLCRQQSSSAPSAACALRAWAAPLCEVVCDAHVGRGFEPSALESVYAADAVFDDPCGTIASPAGIVHGFRAIHGLFEVSAAAAADDFTYHPALVGGGLVFSEDAVSADITRRWAPDGGLDAVPAQARLPLVATYALRAAPALRFELTSTVVLNFDEERQKVVRHEDRWWGKPVTLNAGHRLYKRIAGRAFAFVASRWYA